MTLDERKATILRAVVEEYIETAQPVGSGRIAQAPGVKVSSATVRNDMALLEQEGYLAQPHTSAGRVPTEKGYRFFVDGLDVPSLSNGVVDKHTIEFDEDVDELRLTAVAAMLVEPMVGETLAAAAAASIPTTPDNESIVRHVIRALAPAEHHDEQVFIGGASR